MLLCVALVFTVAAFYGKATKIYPFAILMIAIALLFQVSLLTNYVLPYGSDVPSELYVFRITQIASHWNPVFFVPTDQVLGRYNAMLSITVLPTVYSNMLGMDPTWVYKLLYPLIFSLVPVGLYVLWQPYIGKKFSFLAAALFMAQSTFFTEMTALNRQMIGELFFVLLLLVLLNKKIKTEGKFITFVVLSLGLIFSHYALAEIFLMLIFAAWATSTYLKHRSSNLQSSLIIFFFVAMFAWYIYTSGAVVFNSSTSFATQIASQFGGIFSPASRGTEVLTGLGLTQSPSMLNTISRGFAYLTEVFIVIGLVALIAKKTHFHFERDYTIFSIVALFILVALVGVPGLANALNMTRFYHILLMFLAPFCIIGIWASCQFVFKRERKLLVALLIVVVLVPYFMFQTNLVYEVTKADSWSIPLSEYRMDPLRLYGQFGTIDSYSVYGARWVSNYVPYQNNLYADNGLYTALTGYGLVYPGYALGFTNTTVLLPGQFLYLSYISNFENMTTGNNSYAGVFNQTDLVYSNGGSEIYCGAGG